MPQAVEDTFSVLLAQRGPLGLLSSCPSFPLSPNKNLKKKKTVRGKQQVTYKCKPITITGFLTTNLKVRRV